MRSLTMALCALVLMLGLTLVAQAEKKAKKVTLKGEITCTKCSLKETAACGNAIVVKKGDKKVTYYFIDKGRKEKYHRNICRGGKPGEVTGVVSKKGKKMYIKPEKVKFD